MRVRTDGSLANVEEKSGGGVEPLAAGREGGGVPYSRFLARGQRIA